MRLCEVGALCFTVLHLSSCLRIDGRPPQQCSQKGLGCKVSTSNCLDKDWLVRSNYTPSAPEHLEVEVDTRPDQAGNLVPVLFARWGIKDDGSIRFLKASELQVLARATNQQLCVRYSLLDYMPMRNPSGEKWSFTVDMVEVDPGQTYWVSVFNLPKPELRHSSYDISREVSVPDCEDSRMQRSRFCIERGSLWQPNITLTHFNGSQGRSTLTVVFNTDELSDSYKVLLKCSTFQHFQGTYKNNQTSLNVTFNLEDWPRACCNFTVEIEPFHLQCYNDCVRRSKKFHICPTNPVHAHLNFTAYIFVALGVVLLCVLIGGVRCVFCRPDKAQPGGVPQNNNERQQSLPNQHPKVLVIYSHDHHLYRNIVLKLCAFLKARCGTEVLLDLLDTASVGTMGRLRWLEWQMQQLNNPSDKILVLCSRGVQFKWRAMCGQGQITLREDVLSPTDDMLIPFFNLFLPDMHLAPTLGKYLVAYFDDVSSEQDVPSIFDIAVKYKLMKHFEELYFRILDIEKYQPDQVNYIEGIGGDEYFNCPSGRALRNAIETFQAYQMEYPDWFQMECVHNEEDVMAESDLLNGQLEIPPVLEYIPLLREGPPVYIHEVEINESNDGVYTVTPELDLTSDISVMELIPKVTADSHHIYPLHPLVVALPGVITDHPYPLSYGAEPSLNKPLQLTQPGFHLEEKSQCQDFLKNEGEGSLTNLSKDLPEGDQRLVALQKCSSSNPNAMASVAVKVDAFSPPEVRKSERVELEKEGSTEPSGKGPNSGSDQGYISEMPSQHASALVEHDPLVVLARLQDELFQKKCKIPTNMP
ncbi:interleukin 17 receptor A1a isoform X1 [Lampris incognitus]|uniref:interleukin 17 receptor A1a isoform X1 n=1 Tax=Lampris incognitus TaxID=2546036 RepID=UPI0024B4BD28|nr:interleukin 17 receptor A1a isoform X1 [Lampris incognitus]